MVRFASAVALAFGLMTIVGSAHAQDDRENARVQFERGVGLYQAADYAAALEAFQEAYRLAPHPTVRVNMANCYEHLNRPIEAIHHFEQFLAESENVARAQRREVEAALERLRGQVGQVRLAVAPDGAQITIDQHETRRAPVLEPVLMTVGAHTVTVTLDGYVTQTEEIRIEGGETQRVSIRLERGTNPPAVATGPATTEPVAAADAGAADSLAAEPDELAEDEPVAEAAADPEVVPSETDDGGGFQLRVTTPVIIFGSATAALGIGAIVTGVLALSFNDQFEDAVLRVNAASNDVERSQARADGRSAADTANALSITTDVLVIGTIAAAGATAFFVIAEGLSGQDDSMAAHEGVEVIAVPSADPNGGGLSLLGSF